ncbi:hypothetical protein PR001_g6076 [Phytophthora rubi]|uniref:Reverse transcriptase domain-containing protein n=1 Tax=Phytophthora rubi TaxID=129364 RepID=A0A6A3NGU0_9STRA|nr:hypothetical protein PR001_g6076 [Phytophthora rubi]
MSLRALVDCGASNNFVRLQSLARLDSEEVVMPRSLLEVRLATGVVVSTEKRVVRVRFSYLEKFVDEFIVLDLDDKFDMVLGMPWIARHDPVVDWTKRTIAHFGSSGATVSDGPVGAAHAPRGTCDPPAEAARRAAASGHHTRTPTTERVVGRKCESNQKTQVRSDSRGYRSIKSDAVVSTISVDKQVQQEEQVTNKGSDLDASAQGADAIGTNVERRPAIRRRGKEGAPALGADAAGGADGCKRPAPEMLACSRAAELHDEASQTGGASPDRHDGRIERICILSDVERVKCEAEELKQLATEGVDALTAKSKKERFHEQGWDSLKSSPFYEVLREYKDVRPDDILAELPQDKGVQHEINLVPRTKYCVTRQWPPPREQVKAIDDFFESRRKAGQVRESKSPHSAPTFCVKTAQGGWRIVRAYNKLNDATVPAQTPIPRKGVIVDSMASSTIFSALDLRDGFYQIIMRESDIPLTAVSTPSGML